MTMTRTATAPLLRVDQLRISVDTNTGPKELLHGIDLELAHGQTIGLVGESGSGKSVTCRSIIRLLPAKGHVEGEIIFNDESVLSMSKQRLAQYRASQTAMIFQDSRAHINPVHRIGSFLTEGARQTAGMNKTDATDRARTLLQAMGIHDADRRLNQYPHELSGGLLQRVMIAASLMLQPQLLLADEPTTALDVTTQEEVMAILDEQCRERGLAMIFVTHDLDLAAAVCDNLLVMQKGAVVEELAAHEVYEEAKQDYTKSLLAARLEFAQTATTASSARRVTRKENGHEPNADS